MTLLALGLNHQTAPVALRERVAVARESVADALASLRAIEGVREAALLSTCNRTELYCTVDPGAIDAPRRWLTEHHGLGAGQLDEFLYRHEDADAVRHVFRVAAGLDSMVLGEPQILGQVKEAYQLARDPHSLGPVLERLFQNTFAVAKRVRTETRIGASPVSVAFAAVRLAQRVFAELDKSTALLVGAGDTIELVARHLSECGIGRVLVANRTLANAELLAARFGAEALALADLPKHLAEADIVVCSTASRDPIVMKPDVASALRARRHRPMLFIDLAVPRDVEPSVATLDDVFVYNVDDLGGIIAEGLRSREAAAREAEAIVDLSVEHFVAWWRALEGHGPLKQLRQASETERDLALAKAREQLARGGDPAAVLGWLANTLTNKLLHAPSANLRAAALRGDADLLRAAERLFAPGGAPKDNDNE